MEARLHILLPVHNRRATTVRFVEALARQTWREFHLLLIDDGSTDGTAEAVRAAWPEVEVIAAEGNRWWAGALQLGAEHLVRAGVSDDDVLLLINDDVEIAPEFLAQGLAELSRSEDTLLLARQVDAASGREIDGGGGVHADLRRLRFRAARTEAEINCLPTRGLFLRWRDWRRAGGFRPEWLPHYMSDYEFTLRAGKRGLALRVAREAAVGVQTEQTGRSLANLFRERRARRLRLLFSPRFKDNPVTWSAFAWLATPVGWRPFLLAKIWLNFVRTAARCVWVPVSLDGKPPRGRQRVRTGVRALARVMVPEPILRRVRIVRQGRLFRGDYADWAAAKAASGGYDSAEILNRVLAATRAVRAGQAAFERDGVLFREPEPDAPLLGALRELVEACGGGIRVLDFGGSLGSLYWRQRPHLPAGAIRAWDVVEQPAFVEAGRRHVAGEGVRFFNTVEEAEAVARHDVLLCSGTLQYLERPAEAVAGWARTGIAWIVCNNLPLHDRRPTRLRVQHVPPEIYPATYPVWFFNRDEFLAWVRPHFEVVREYPAEAVWPFDSGMYPSTGLVLRRRDSVAR